MSRSSTLSFARANHCPAPPFEDPSCLFGLEGLAVYRLDTLRLLAGQCAELLRASALRQAAVVLGQKSEQEIDQALGHIEEGLDLAAEIIVALQEACFGGKILFDRLLDTGIEKFRVWCGVEVAVEVSGVVQDADIEFRRRLPLDQWQQAPRI